LADGFSFDEMLDEYDEEIFTNMDIWVNIIPIMLSYPDSSSNVQFLYCKMHVQVCNIKDSLYGALVINEVVFVGCYLQPFM
jgi:hypothetical protein